MNDKNLKYGWLNKDELKKYCLLLSDSIQETNKIIFSLQQSIYQLGILKKQTVVRKITFSKKHLKFNWYNYER